LTGKSIQRSSPALTITLGSTIDITAPRHLGVAVGGSSSIAVGWRQPSDIHASRRRERSALLQQSHHYAKASTTTGGRLGWPGGAAVALAEQHSQLCHSPRTMIEQDTRWDASGTAVVLAAQRDTGSITFEFNTW